MLILTRSVKDKIIIPDVGIIITLTEIYRDGRRARIGIEAPENMKIYRHELMTKDQRDIAEQIMRGERPLGACYIPSIKAAYETTQNRQAGETSP